MGGRCFDLCDVGDGVTQDSSIVRERRSSSLSGLSPFGGQDDEQTMENIRRGDVHFPKEIFGDISDDGKDFMKKLLVKNRK